MIFSGSGILLDIEGTTSSISFVHDVMFPFVRRESKVFLAKEWYEPAVQAACDQIAQDAGHGNFSDWCGERAIETQQEILRGEVERLMDGDVKATGLKSLQGLIWRSGFEQGELVAHVYDDVVPAIKTWRANNIDVRIYSSGSVTSQRLFFGHTEQGDLLGLFSGHYDTQIGGKKEVASYRAIANEFHGPASQLLFVSDVVDEVDAAREAGFQTALCVRPGNVPIGATHDHVTIASFAEIQLS